MFGMHVREENGIEIFVGKQEGKKERKKERKKGHLEDVSTDGSIIVKRILKDRVEGVDFIHLTEDGVLVNTVINLWEVY
jgi:hypothetical protein